MPRARRSYKITVAPIPLQKLAKASTTNSKYDSHLRSFKKFCGDNNLPVLPDEYTIISYIETMSLFILPDSVGTYLTGIKSRLKIKFPWIHQVFALRSVKDTLRGARRERSKPKKHTNPIKISHIETIFSSSSDTYEDLLFLTITTLGFSALHRLAELVQHDTVKHHNQRQIILRCTFQISDCRRYLTYVLPYHKGDPLYKGTNVLIAPRPGNRCCPVRIATLYVRARDSRFGINPFLLLRANGEVPCRSWYTQRLSNIFGKSLTGHSLRAGGATALAEAGLSFESIQVAGRWKSQAFQDYIHSHPLLNLQTLLANPIDAQNHVGAQVHFQARPAIG